MIFYTAFATVFLFGVVNAQMPKLSSCVTKDQNLQMTCVFTLVPDSKPLSCYYTTENKTVGSTNASMAQDPTFKNRATVTITENKCELNLKGFSDDKPKNYTCFVKQNSVTSTSQIVDKSKLQTCSGWCVMQHSGVVLLLAFLTFPLLSELL